MKYEIKEGNYAAMGVTRQGRDLVFTFAAKQNQTCAVLLYDRESGKKQFKSSCPWVSGRFPFVLSAYGI